VLLFPFLFIAVPELNENENEEWLISVNENGNRESSGNILKKWCLEKQN